MKLPAYIKPQAIATELVAVVVAALIWAYVQRNVPDVRAWQRTDPNA